MDMNYYREHAAKYLPLYRGRSNQRNKEEPNSKDPFLNSTAPRRSSDDEETVSGAERQLPLYPGPKPTSAVKGPGTGHIENYSEAQKRAAKEQKK